MLKYIWPLVAAAFFMRVSPLCAQFSVENKRPIWKINNGTVINTPPEGLWSVATSWQDDWPADWIHLHPLRVDYSEDWTIITGRTNLPGGTLYARDTYQQLDNGMTKCIRRYEWKGDKTLKNVTLSVRLKVNDADLKAFAPGIIYYGNENGARIDRNKVPVFNCKPGEFALFEDHRYGMPFFMLENSHEGYAATLHTSPSPVRGAVLSDQWWSLGAESYDGYTEFVLLSGPIGYNGSRSVAKARQVGHMQYTDTYIDLHPGMVVEKVFYVDLSPVKESGTGFQKQVYHALDLYQPYDADRFPAYAEILESKYKFAQSRWIEGNTPGFCMYPMEHQDIVMGWCGQADSPGFALQALEKRLGDVEIVDKVQRSMDFLASTTFHDQGLFHVGFRVKDKHRYGGDHVSCGQAMYNFAKAIELARKDRRYETEKWEMFLKKACDGAAHRILQSDWDPHSTAEGFYIAPLALASKLFKNQRYKEAAVKAAHLFAERHYSNASYWGGTLDATCEDKEGAWAAFQGFLELYEHFGKDEHLKWAKHAMDVCLSYLVVWDIPYPSGRLADHNFKSTGWTVVSPQNQHIDVYGVLFSPEVYRMGVILKDDRLQKLAKVMYRSCFQLTDALGSQGEQIQQTNFAQHGDMSNVHRLRGGYSESWTVFWITAHFLNAAGRFELMGVEL